MFFMMDCRIEIEADNIEQATRMSDDFAEEFNRRQETALFPATLYVDAVRPTTGQEGNS